MSRRETCVELKGRLVTEAIRQLRICNACRYCEDYCALFTSLERRAHLTESDVTHLAHLCHDCRNCYYACMYAPPHSFAVNPPRLFSELRRLTYDGELDTQGGRDRWRGWRAALCAYGLSAFVLVGVLWLRGDWRSLLAHHEPPASPYGVVAYPAILVVALVPCAWSALVIARSARRYWRAIRGGGGPRVRFELVRKALSSAGAGRHSRGGGVGCAYPDEAQSPTRRRLHAVVAYGFVTLLLSTMTSAVLQDGFGANPPFGVLSVPVGLGLIGGIGVTLGCSGLIILKTRSDPGPADAPMIIRDYGLLIALDLLAITGLLTLALRNTPAFGVVFVVHLAVVVGSFAVAPSTKFVHFVYRLLSVVRDTVERTAKTE